ncbi:MAG: Atxe2 family lasso peptide isopeptidase [Erythrobacter sp.]|uniref:Atxe2 family lasso peptide isopeptidase n=1 Tax=Erythrobacter sp. TaxID=1042 RepID=UPI001B0F2736|nr:Atxe2 family lasso peptide isopeptidase [Erythrobacter sp.]MBO6767376.1 Atxe2 family lasso peptide isopeptidase [Erythrobacter sp.]
MMAHLVAVMAQATAFPAPPSPDADPCMVLDQVVLDEPRPITIEDQVTIADIGRASAGPAPAAFGISPDGLRIAVIVTRANPEVNLYCRRMLVMPMNGDGQPIEVDRGGEFNFDDYPLRNFAAIRAGWERPNTPRWSPDGQSIAFLRRVDGSTQVWLADPDGQSPAHQATQLTDDVIDFAWSPDGSSLLVESRPGLRSAREAIEQEGRSGFLFDTRFMPQLSEHPLPTGSISSQYTHVSLGEGSTRLATSDEIALLNPHRSRSIPTEARAVSIGIDGRTAWLGPKHPERLLSPTRIVVAWPDGTQSVCESAACEGVRAMWWAPDDGTLVLQQQTGWANSQTALLRWEQDTQAPVRILGTDDVLIGCTMHASELVCAREGSVQPRRLVAINLENAEQRILFDPNPLFQELQLGEVQRLRFRNAYGVESFADLVLPPDHQPGERHPLVVVQYRSSGFLRGGTGDEVPIQPLAARGFAVLSFDRPNFRPEAYTATTEAEMRTAIGEDWGDRRNVQSSLEIAIAMAVDTGTIDPERMGISGFSDGSATVQFALVNSDLFRVASMGSCCEDMYSFALAAGPAFTDFLRDMDYRYFEPGAEEFWRPMSLILNAEDIDVPLLIQSGDSEYEGALDVVETLSHRGKGIELHVFPDEPHFKWQPAHRRAMYERFTEWFEFWLMAKINCDPNRVDQYNRWRAMPGALEEDAYVCTDPSAHEP